MTQAELEAALAHERRLREVYEAKVAFLSAHHFPCMARSNLSLAEEERQALQAEVEAARAEAATWRATLESTTARLRQAQRELVAEVAKREANP